MKIMKVGSLLVTKEVFKQIPTQYQIEGLEINLIDSIEMWNSIKYTPINNINKKQNFTNFLKQSKVPNSISLLETLKSRLFREEDISLKQDYELLESKIKITTNLDTKLRLQRKQKEINSHWDYEYKRAKTKFQNSTIEEILKECRKLGWAELRSIKNFGPNCENLLREIAAAVKIKL